MTPNTGHTRWTFWTSFVADCDGTGVRLLHEQGNPDHRLRVEHNPETLLVRLSDEDGHGCTVLAVDRATRRWAVSQAARQLDAAEDAFSRLNRRGLTRGVEAHATSGQVLTLTVTTTSLGCVVSSRFESSKMPKTLTTQVEGPAQTVFAPVWPAGTVTLWLADPHQRTNRL